MRRFRRFPVRARKPYRWKRQVSTLTIAAGASTTTDFLTVADYNFDGSLSPSGVTVKRIVLDFTISAVTLQAAHDLSDIRWAIFAVDEDQAALAVTSSNVTDERIVAMGCFGMLLGGTTLGPGSMVFPHVHVDTKQNIRLQNTELRFVITESGADGVLGGTMMSSVLLVGDTS